MNNNSSNKNKQKELMKSLRNCNLLLKRNSMITDSIMKITSEVLSSGEIDFILHTILEKAIEIIPIAQKGSILIYDGNVLHFNATRGYDSGDEFAIIFRDNDMSQTKMKISKIRQAFLNHPFTYCGKTITSINFACGIVQFPSDGSEFQDLMKLADIRMYEDKRIQKKPVC